MTPTEPDQKRRATPTPASVARRLRMVLWKQHQPYIAVLLVGSVVGMIAYFLFLSLVSDGLVDFDTASPIQIEFAVDINSADWPELVNLPGVGEKLARAIVAQRQKFGPFQSLPEIQNVPGIGPSKYRQLEPFLLPIEP